MSLVRLARPEDMAAVYALRHEVFVVGQDVPADLERDEHDAAADHAVAVEDAVVVGTGRLLAPDQLGRRDGIAVVGRMAVRRAARCAGTGAALLAVLEQRGRERGFSGIELHAQSHARGFYERAGYAAFGRPYAEAGIEHISMVKSLVP